MTAEDTLQSHCCKILDLMQLPYFSIPNGANKASYAARATFKATGLKPGVPDLFVCKPIFKPFYHKCGLFIEIKTEKGVVSVEQRKWLKALEELGYFCRVVRSTKALEALLLECYPDHAKKFKHLK